MFNRLFILLVSFQPQLRHGARRALDCPPPPKRKQTREPDYFDMRVPCRFCECLLIAHADCVEHVMMFDWPSNVHTHAHTGTIGSSRKTLVQNFQMLHASPFDTQLPKYKKAKLLKRYAMDRQRCGHCNQKHLRTLQGRQLMGDIWARLHDLAFQSCHTDLLAFERHRMPLRTLPSRSDPSPDAS